MQKNMKKNGNLVKEQSNFKDRDPTDFEIVSLHNATT